MTTDTLNSAESLALVRHSLLCAGRHVGGEDVVGVTVQGLSRPVVAHGCLGIGVTSGDLDVAEADAGVEHVVTNVWRSMSGCISGIRIPDAEARCLSRRVAACRSMRAPMVLRRIGP